MNSIECRNKLEATFESMIVNFVKPDIDVSIQEGTIGNSMVDNLMVDNSTVTIEQIIDFYLENEKSIDLEGMFRAFLTAVHFATNDESARLSRWLYRVRPELLQIIPPKLMVNILMKKLCAMIKNTESEFMHEYFMWLTECYCDNNSKINNRSMLIGLVNRINAKLRKKQISSNLHGSLWRGPRIDNIKSLPNLEIHIENLKVVNLILTVYRSLSDLYDRNM